MKNNKGITLIALVITIIVLLILAGIAVSMLSGENGILKKAAEAKTKTEQSQQEEEVSLSTMDLETHFLTNNLKYKCKDGFVTGFKLVSGCKTEETVKNFEENVLPTGYKINMKYDEDNEKDIKIEENEKEEMTITTGMSIQKDGKTVARTVVFGNIKCREAITAADNLSLQKYVQNMTSKKDFQIVAMDTNHDGYISLEDYVLEDGTEVTSDIELIERCTDGNSSIIEQSKYASKSSQLKELGKRTVMKEFLDSLPEEFKKSNFNLECDDETGKCTLKGVTATTKVGDVLSLLININAIITKPRVTYANDDIIQNNSKLTVTINKKYGISELVFNIEY